MIEVVVYLCHNFHSLNELKPYVHTETLLIYKLIIQYYIIHKCIVELWRSLCKYLIANEEMIFRIS